MTKYLLSIDAITTVISCNNDENPVVKINSIKLIIARANVDLKSVTIAQIVKTVNKTLTNAIKKIIQ